MAGENGMESESEVNTTLIIVAAVIILFFCCCASGVVLWFTGDSILELLDLAHRTIAWAS